MKKSSLISIFGILILLALNEGCEDWTMDWDWDSDKPTVLNPDKIRIGNAVRDSLKGEIVYMVDASIFRMDAEYFSSELVFPGAGYDAFPKWSPDGSKIAFYRINTELHDSVYLTFQRLTIVNKDGNLLYECIFGEYALTQGITWSPDGTTVAVLYKPNGFYGSNEIMYIDIYTGEKTIIKLPSRSDEHYNAIAWSPTRSKLAVSSRIGSIWTDYIKNSIWLFDAYDSNLVKNPNNLLLELDYETTNIIEIDYMDWSPDGSWLAYSGGGFGSVFLVRNDGSDNHEIILKEPFQDESIYGLKPCWSSNNKQIIFTGVKGVNGFDYISGLFVTDINGSYKVNLNIKGNSADWH